MSGLAKQLSDMYIQKKNEYYLDLANDLMKLTADNQSSKVWQTVNKITNRKTVKTGLIPAEDNNERLRLWHDHFKNLLSPEVVPSFIDLQLPKLVSGVNFKVNEFDATELKIAISSFKNNKSCGIDNITSEILKIEELHPFLLDLINFIYIKKEIPDEWLKSILIPIFKKGDSNLCTNYRGIALMSVVAKLYNRLLLNRLRDGLLKHLRPSQNGFLPMRSTAQHVLTLRRIFEEIEQKQDMKVISIFIDYIKAFDSVDWNYIQNILLAYNVPNELVSAIMSVYYGAKATVRFNTELSEYFNLGVGVLQGDNTLAPFYS